MFSFDVQVEICISPQYDREFTRINHLPAPTINLLVNPFAHDRPSATMAVAVNILQGLKRRLAEECRGHPLLRGSWRKCGPYLVIIAIAI